MHTRDLGELLRGTLRARVRKFNNRNYDLSPVCKMTALEIGYREVQRQWVRLENVPMRKIADRANVLHSLSFCSSII